MARLKAAWGMEVGASAVKAIRLERDGDSVSVSDFIVVPHRKVLATPDIDQDEIIRLSLGQFISQKDLEGERIVASVPGHSAFARFAKLPPVEPKKVPDIVKFEAVQQIPFPIEQVEWDYQTFTSDDSPEVEVGIFAITRDRVQQRLNLYRELGISPAELTLSPVSVYNAMVYDHDLSQRPGPVVYLDIGTQATDVIVAEHGRCWIRTFPLGGTHFTEAIASAFKISYSKAEKLKQEAASSKYAKQIMQAMRPVFSDLLQDLQRSIGYYQSLHREAELTTMVGLGATFKIPGLRKFLGQQLQIQVLRLDEYKKIQATGREASTFAQNAVGLATAYGLALQGVGLARIAVNLVPVENVRVQLWREKTKWFAAAAAIVVVGSGMMLYRPIRDRGAVAASEPPVVSQVLAMGGRLKREYQQLSSSSNVGYAAENFRRLVDYRDVWPSLVADASAALTSAEPQPALLSADAEKIREIPPPQRRLVRLERLGGQYYYDPESRRISVTMQVRLSHERPIRFLNETVAAWLRANAERPGVPYRILDETVSCNPNQQQTVRVTDAGEHESAGGGAPRRTPPSGRDRTPPPPPPGGTGASGGTGGTGVGSGGPMMGRRSRGQKRQAPGDAAAGGMSGGGGGAPTGGTSYGGRGTVPSYGGSRGTPRDTAEHASLEELAPLPEKPALYPPGSEYYIVPVTFQVELLDPRAPESAERTASRGAAGAGS